MLTRVEVTAQDIKNGTPGTCFDCPIACALNRICCAADWDCEIAVFGEEARFMEDAQRPIEVDLPEEALRFIVNFDAGRLVQPFAFDLDIPDAFLKPAGGA